MALSVSWVSFEQAEGLLGVMGVMGYCPISWCKLKKPCVGLLSLGGGIEFGRGGLCQSNHLVGLSYPIPPSLCLPPTQEHLPHDLLPSSPCSCTIWHLLVSMGSQGSNCSIGRTTQATLPVELTPWVVQMFGTFVAPSTCSRAELDQVDSLFKKVRR